MGLEVRHTFRGTEKILIITKACFQHGAETGALNPLQRQIHPHSLVTHPQNPEFTPRSLASSLDSPWQQNPDGDGFVVLQIQGSKVNSENHDSCFLVNPKNARVEGLGNSPQDARVT